MGDKLSLKHYLLKNRGTDGQLTIYLRITYNRKKAEIHSGFLSNLKQWNDVDQVVKSNPVINKELADQKAKVYDILINLKNKQLPISANILKEYFLGENEVIIALISFFQTYTEEIQARNEIKTKSLAKYHQSIASLKEFVLYKFRQNDITIKLLNFEFINAYDIYLANEKKLNRNTINKYHSRLKSVINQLQGLGYINHNPYSNFKLSTVKSERIFLDNTELKKIEELDLSNNLSLEKVRDIFIFSCYTGIRFQDAQSLKESNLTKTEEQSYIKFNQQKTSNSVFIPLLPKALQIIEKYSCIEERIILKKLLPKITNQKLNAYLKVIANLAGIDKELTHHMARHTFATTVCLNNNMPMEDLSKLLGHSSIKTTQIYGRITEQRLTKSIENITKNLSK
jgi:site-specific recombinase XerD